MDAISLEVEYLLGASCLVDHEEHCKNGRSTAKKQTEPFHEVIPHHMSVRIFDLLDTKERARIATVCKAWRDLTLENCSTIQLSFTALKQLEAQRKWLDVVAKKGANAVRSVQMHWHGGQLLHPAAGSLHVEQFTNLRSLDLKPMNSAYWAINPKAVKGLASLQQLEELVVVFSPCSNKKDVVLAVTLEQFAIFPRMKHLSIQLQPSRGWESGWQLVLSPALSELKRLQSLTLAGVTTLYVNQMLMHIVSRLTKLDLEIREPVTQVLDAPRLEYLRYYCGNGEELPFCGSSSLKELVYNGELLPASVLSNYPELRAISLGHLTQDIDVNFVRHLVPLHSLRTVKLMWYCFEEQVETLEAFASLANLEELHLTTMLPYDLTYQPSPKLALLKRLKTLKLYSHVNGYIALRSGIEHLPALESLYMEVRNVQDPICSKTLKNLCLEGLGGYVMQSCPVLGDLPQLRSLQLKLLPSLTACKALVDQLGNTPLLRELFLAKGYVSCPRQPILKLHLDEDPTGTLEQALHVLKRLKNLTALQVAAVNDDLRLSKRILPEVEHLGIACRGLAVCASCVPWPCSTLDLISTSVNQYTIEQLELCHRVEFAKGIDIRLGTVYTARIHDSDKSLPFEFGDDLFDDQAEALQL